MVRKASGTILDVRGQVSSNRFDQSQHHSELKLLPRFVCGVARDEVWQSPSHVQLLVRGRYAIASRMVCDICITQIACRFAAADVLVIPIQEVTPVSVKVINEEQLRMHSCLGVVLSLQELR